jgi:glycosyltransferase involved in cell wall biosynthesis
VSKILIVGPAYPLRGGLATYNERLAKEFNAMGHTCHILSFSLQYPSLLFPGKTQYSTDAAPADTAIYSEINSINPFNWIGIGRKIKKAAYDIVIFRYWMSFMAPAFGTIASIIRLNKHTRILTICDNLIPHEQKFFDKPFTGYFINKCDGFLTMSKAVKQQLLDWPVNLWYIHHTQCMICLALHYQRPMQGKILDLTIIPPTSCFLVSSENTKACIFCLMPLPMRV